jgi:hypothetical protein
MVCMMSWAFSGDKKAPPFMGEGPFTAGTELTAQFGATIALGAIRLL